MEFAIVTGFASNYRSWKTVSPHQWKIIEIRRETPTRLYVLDKKPSGFSEDPFYSKDLQIIGRFETEADALALHAKAVKWADKETRDLAAAKRADEEARQQGRDAFEAMRLRMISFWKED